MEELGEGLMDATGFSREVNAFEAIMTDGLCGSAQRAGEKATTRHAESGTVSLRAYRCNSAL